MSNRSYLQPLAPLLLSAALAACAVRPVITPQGSAQPSPAGLVQHAATGPVPSGPAPNGQALIAGRVLAPPGLVAAGGGNVIVNNTGHLKAAGSDGILSHNGAAVVAAAAPRRGLLAIEERPLAGAEVFLADSAGNPLPGRQPVQTAADGTFTIADAPADAAVVVAARVRTADGRAAMLHTIAKPTALGATAEVSGASTMVAAALVSSRSDALEQFNPAVFQTATEATARNMSVADLPDFADRQAVVRRMNELAARISEIQAALDDLRKEIAEIKASIEDLKAMIAGLRMGPAAAMTPPPGSVPPGPGATEPGPTASGATGPGPAGPGPGCAGVFAFLDADGDGGVTIEEWHARFRGGPGEPSAAEVFGFVDGDRDGRLTVAEFVPACEAHGGAEAPDGGNAPAPGGPRPGPSERPPSGPAGGPDCDTLFGYFDDSHDGAIDEAEWRTAPTGPDGQRPPLDAFGHLDADRNGVLDRREFGPICDGPR